MTNRFLNSSPIHPNGKILSNLHVKLLIIVRYLKLQKLLKMDWEILIYTPTVK